MDIYCYEDASGWAVRAGDDEHRFGAKADAFAAAKRLLREHAPGKLLRTAPPGATVWLDGVDPVALVFLSVGAGRPSSLTGLDRHDAVMELLPHMLLTRPDVVRDHVARLISFVEGRVVAALRVGVPDTVEPALRGLMSSAG